MEETRRHIDCLDGWRGLAITTVILGHFFLDAFMPGVSTLGVDIFFVLSGRLMAEILFVQKTALPTFFLRRFSRIYPGLLFYVLGVTALFCLSPYRHGIEAVLTALTFTINYAMVYTHPVALLDHLWSLCVEEHSYLLLALLAVAARGLRWPPLPVVLGVGLAAAANGLFQSLILGKDYFSVFWRTDVQIWPIFAAGATHLFVRGRPAFHRPWIAPLALVSGVVVKLCGGEAVGFAVGSVLLAMGVSTLEYSAGAVRRVFENEAARRLGLWSFSLYLWQQPFYRLHRDHVAPAPPLLLAAFACAAVSFYLVERPARRFLNRRGALLVARLTGAGNGGGRIGATAAGGGPS